MLRGLRRTYGQARARFATRSSTGRADLGDTDPGPAFDVLWLRSWTLAGATGEITAIGRDCSNRLRAIEAHEPPKPAFSNATTSGSAPSFTGGGMQAQSQQ